MMAELLTLTGDARRDYRTTAQKAQAKKRRMGALLALRMFTGIPMPGTASALVARKLFKNRKKIKAAVRSALPLSGEMQREFYMQGIDTDYLSGDEQTEIMGALKFAKLKKIGSGIRKAVKKVATRIKAKRAVRVAAGAPAPIATAISAVATQSMQQPGAVDSSYSQTMPGSAPGAVAPMVDENGVPVATDKIFGIDKKVAMIGGAVLAAGAVYMISRKNRR
jgi:hypothetical protein